MKIKILHKGSNFAFTLALAINSSIDNELLISLSFISQILYKTSLERYTCYLLHTFLSNCTNFYVLILGNFIIVAFFLNYFKPLA